MGVFTRMRRLLGRARRGCECEEREERRVYLDGGRAVRVGV